MCVTGNVKSTPYYGKNIFSKWNMFLKVWQDQCLPVAKSISLKNCGKIKCGEIIVNLNCVISSLSVLINYKIW